MNDSSARNIKYCYHRESNPKKTKNKFLMYHTDNTKG